MLAKQKKVMNVLTFQHHIILLQSLCFPTPENSHSLVLCGGARTRSISIILDSLFKITFIQTMKICDFFPLFAKESSLFSAQNNEH